MFFAKNKATSLFSVFFAVGLIFFSRKRSAEPAKITSIGKKARGNPSGFSLRFSLTVDKNTYLHTDYGEPPQLAIWLESPNGKFFKTVVVTQRPGDNNWMGKVDCPVTFPIWELKQFVRKRRPDDIQQIRVVTGATPKGGVSRTSVRVPPGSRWRYFVGVNASGDFNDAFPHGLKEGGPDDGGNGQPSLVYSGEIVAKIGQKDTPKLVGFTDQFTPVDTLRTDFEKITTARRLVRKIAVEILKN